MNLNPATWFASGVDKIVDSVSDGLDSLFTSDEERLTAKRVLEQVKLEATNKSEEIGLEHEKEITKRWTSDNEHVVTRLVRPLSYIFVLILFGSILLVDGNIGEFKINPAYIPVLESLLAIMTVAYFGSRGAEKVAKSIQGKK